jgi:hypothetical protein
VDKAIGIFVSFAAMAYPFALLFYLIIGPNVGSLDTFFAGIAMFGVVDPGCARDALFPRFRVRCMRPVEGPAARPVDGSDSRAGAVVDTGLHGLGGDPPISQPSLAEPRHVCPVECDPAQRMQALDKKKAELRAQSARTAEEESALARAHEEQFKKLPPDAPTADLLPFVSYQETSYHALPRILASKDKEAYFERAEAALDRRANRRQGQPRRHHAHHRLSVHARMVREQEMPDAP